MANVVKLRRTTTIGKVPTTSDIVVGEVGLNITDKRAFSSDGSNVFEIGANVGSQTVGANSSVNGYLTSFVRFTTTGAISQNIDSFAIATWRTGCYKISVKDNNANNYMAATATLIHDGGVATVAVSDVVYTNTYIGTFTATANSTHAILQYTPTSTNTTLSMTRTVITI